MWLYSHSIRLGPVGNEWCGVFHNAIVHKSNNTAKAISLYTCTGMEAMCTKSTRRNVCFSFRLKHEFHRFHTAFFASLAETSPIITSQLHEGTEFAINAPSTETEFIKVPLRTSVRHFLWLTRLVADAIHQCQDLPILTLVLQTRGIVSGPGWNQFDRRPPILPRLDTLVSGRKNLAPVFRPLRKWVIHLLDGETLEINLFITVNITFHRASANAHRRVSFCCAESPTHSPCGTKTSPKERHSTK